LLRAAAVNFYCCGAPRRCIKQIAWGQCGARQRAGPQGDVRHRCNVSTGVRLPIIPRGAAAWPASCTRKMRIDPSHCRIGSLPECLKMFHRRRRRPPAALGRRGESASRRSGQCRNVVRDPGLQARQRCLFRLDTGDCHRAAGSLLLPQGQPARFPGTAARDRQLGWTGRAAARAGPGWHAPPGFSRAKTGSGVLADATKDSQAATEWPGKPRSSMLGTSGRSPVRTWQDGRQRHRGGDAGRDIGGGGGQVLHHWLAGQQPGPRAGREGLWQAAAGASSRP
jgi:hypothetical protein